MPRPRVIVFGYGDIALAALDALAHSGSRPLALVLPSNRSGASVQDTGAKARAAGYRVLVQPPKREIAPFLDTIRELAPDLLFVWSYSMLLPPELVALAPRGAVNLHGGILPEYRGGHVMNWAIINGERESAATLHYIDAGIDTGPVIAERRFALDPNDDIVAAQEKLKIAGTELLRTWWPRIEQGTAMAVPQDESRARYHRMRTPADGRIDWTQSNVQIHNLVRALAAPWPGAFTRLGDHTITARRVQPVDGSRAPAGTITRLDDGELRVATGDGELKILAIEIDGRPATPADLRRLGAAEGLRL